MEPVKVDIRKLQLLNDRINQTLDALNQVRLSAHGLGHTSQGVPNVFGAQLGGYVPNVWGAPYGAIGQYPGVLGAAGLGHTTGHGMNPAFPTGVNPMLGLYGQHPALLAQLQGLAHTTPGIPGVHGMLQPQHPWAAGIHPNWIGGLQGLSHTANFGMNPAFPTSVNNIYGQIPGVGIGQIPGVGINPLAMGGLAHTSPEGLQQGIAGQGVDPLFGLRVAQTFPFAQWSYTPFASPF